MGGLFFEHLAAVAARDAERVAVIFDAGSLSYGALVEHAGRIARGLSSRGLDGARLGLLAGAGAEWVEAFAGVVAAGSTVVPLTELYARRELELLVQASRARALITPDALFDMATQVAGRIPVFRVRELATDERGGRGGGSVTPGAGPALLLFTSGTTGRPKGVPISERSMVHLARTLAEAWGFRSEDVLLHILPLHHLHGIGVSLLAALVSGAGIRFLSRFDAAITWDALASATVLMGVPTQHKKLFDAFDAAPAERRAAWSGAAAGLRLVTSGSAALPAALGERWRGLAGQFPLERYGMTEIGIVLSNPLAGERRPGSVGLALPGVELRIAGEEGDPLPDGQAGEILVRGPTVFAGYDGDDAATRAAFRDGWFVTGDTARRAPDGYVTILGRTSVDILKSGGEKISALEIEDALRQHPDIAEVAVVGLPDETWGEAVVAVIVPRDGLAVSEASLRSWAKERLTGYKVPKRVILVDELPRNPLGKVMKKELVRTLARQL